MRSYKFGMTSPKLDAEVEVRYCYHRKRCSFRFRRCHHMSPEGFRTLPTWWSLNPTLTIPVSRPDSSRSSGSIAGGSGGNGTALTAMVGIRVETGSLNLGLYFEYNGITSTRYEWWKQTAPLRLSPESSSLNSLSKQKLPCLRQLWPLVSGGWVLLLRCRRCLLSWVSCSILVWGLFIPKFWYLNTCPRGDFMVMVWSRQIGFFFCLSALADLVPPRFPRGPW